MAPAQRWSILALALLAACGRGEGTGDRDQRPAPPTAAALYKQHCASCHGSGAILPYDDGFKRMRPEAVVAAMRGIMAEQAKGLDDGQRIAVAEYLTGRRLGDAAPQTAPVTCAEWQNRLDFNRPPGMAARLSAAEAPRLAVKWAFAFPGATRALARPAVAGGAVFVGGEDGTVLALDEHGGCVRWRFQADAEVRSGIAVTPWQAGDTAAAPLVYFGDYAGNAYALDAQTGRLVWKEEIDPHPKAIIAGAPVLHEGRLYVPVASTEWIAAADPDYGCCSFRGSVAALDAATGARLWQSWAIEADARLTGDTNAAGTPTWTPGGAPVWSSPVVDAGRKRLYMATGAATTSPASPASDAVIALDLETGNPVWRYQATKGDAWTLACIMEDKTNCPAENGPAFDFTAPPLLLRTGDGKDMVVAGQKSGYVHAVDADSGQLIWRARIGRGGFAGGVHWSMAASGEALYVPVADTEFAGQAKGRGQPGLFALDTATGAPLWSSPNADTCPLVRKPACDAGLSAAAATFPGGVLAGGYDGQLRAYDAATGQVIWSLDTTADVTAVNGETVRGGSIEGGGPVVYGNRVFVTSGSLYGGRMPGNVLMVLEPSWNAPPQPAPDAGAAEPQPVSLMP